PGGGHAALHHGQRLCPTYWPGDRRGGGAHQSGLRGELRAARGPEEHVRSDEPVPPQPEHSANGVGGHDRGGRRSPRVAVTPAPNQALHLTASSLRSCVAAASSGRGNATLCCPSNG